MKDGEALVKLTGAAKGFGGTTVLDQFDLEIRSGELVVVLGVNGAGKTTLLRMMAGLLGLDSGELLIDGQALDRFSAEQRSKISFVPDFPAFFEDLTVLENLEAWINLYERTDQNREAEAVAMLEKFGIISQSKLLPQSLSRGQRFKLALTCYQAVKPMIGLFDEPFASGLDPAGLKEMKAIMRSAIREGRAVVYTTQLVKYALEFADRVLVVNKRCIYFDGSPEKFKNQLSGGDEVLAEFSDEE